MPLTSILRTVIVVLFLCFPVLTIQAQSEKFPANREDKSVFNEGESWLTQKEYRKALVYYESLLPKYTVAPLLHYRTGYCYLHLPEGWDKALEYFTLADNGTLDKTEFNFYYGKVLHHMMRFEKARDQFAQYLKAKKTTHALKTEAQHMMEICNNAIALTVHPVPVIITNVNSPINSVYAEYVPLISSDESVLLYTYRGIKSTGGLQPVEAGLPGETDYREDIMMTMKDSTGEWLDPLHLDANINSAGNDAAVAITSDAQRMYMFRSIDNDPGSLYHSELDGITWSDPEKLEGEINSPEWEGSLTISYDGRTAIFSSTRKGGKGQRDLYSARRKKDGSWGHVKNLGEIINTSYNEDAPFLHPSGRYLVFSSDGHNTMGGYDIFISELMSDSSWGKPVNIGYPVNSTDDDKFYTISADGRHGYFASSKTGGLGKFDIYSVEPGLAERPILLAQLRGRVTVRGNPVEASIRVENLSTGMILFGVNSNSYTGRYLVDLPAGINYRITYNLDGYPQQALEVNTIGLQAFREIIHNVEFSSDSAIRPPDTSQHVNITTQTLRLDTVLRTIPKRDLTKLEHPKLVYRVQIGAYRYPWNFKYDHVKNMGEKDETEKLSDAITRFTLGRFSTLQHAYDFRDQVMAKGIGDAFITAIFDNKRYLLTDLGPVLYNALSHEQATLQKNGFFTYSLNHP